MVENPSTWFMDAALTVLISGFNMIFSVTLLQQSTRGRHHLIYYSKDQWKFLTSNRMVLLIFSIKRKRHIFDAVFVK